MWVIRFYTGPLSGKQFPLKMGRNVVGRATYCDVVIQSQGISKEHAVVEIYNDRIQISDNNSRNGTFINGVMIRSQKLSPGDRLAFHDVIVDIVERKSKPNQPRIAAAPAYDGNAALQTRPLQPDYQPNPMVAGPQASIHSAPQKSAEPVPPSLMAYAKRYIDDVLLPGVYRLGEIMEFRMVLVLFVAAFIVLVTTLSTIPLMRILKDSIDQEARNHALTIARNLAEVNRSALQQGLETSVTVDPAMREPGVDSAYVISAINQDIMAPVQQVGQYLTKIPFVDNAIKGDSSAVDQISSSKIAAVVPIRYYNSATGSETTAAYAVVIFDMGTLAVNNGRTLSLFVEILFIAVILGFILFFFMYRLIRQPLVETNQQLVAAMSPEHSGEITTTYHFDQLQTLISNINNLLHRQTGGFGADNLKKFEADRTFEMQNIVNLVGFPALTVQAQDRVIAATNEHFAQQIAQGQSWVGTSVDQILDQSLKLNLSGLLDKVATTPSEVAVDHLEIGNENYDLSAQGVHGSSTALAYVLVVFVPKAGVG